MMPIEAFLRLKKGFGSSPFWLFFPSWQSLRRFQLFTPDAFLLLQVLGFFPSIVGSSSLSPQSFLVCLVVWWDLLRWLLSLPRDMVSRVPACCGELNSRRSVLRRAQDVSWDGSSASSRPLGLTPLLAQVPGSLLSLSIKIWVPSSCIGWIWPS